MFKPYLPAYLTKFRFGRLSKAKVRGKQHTIRGLRPKLRRDWEHENESKNFGIFKEILGFLGSLLGIYTKLQLATLIEIASKYYNCLQVLLERSEVLYFPNEFYI